MGERAEHVAARLDQELSRMADFVSALSGSQLDAASKDPRGATVRHVLEHLREGMDQVVEWAGQITAGPSSAPAAARPHSHSHSHGGADGGTNSGADSAKEIADTVAQLRDGGAVVVGTIRGLTDQQLDGPAPASENMADGVTPVHEIVLFIADDVAGHLRHLKEAVAAGRVPQDVA